MTAADLLVALDLPPGSRVDRRVPKTLLVENGAPTAADKRHINDGIEELFWLAALKSTTIGMPVVETKSSLFTDDLRDSESAKITCGREHFRALEVREAPARYTVARSVDEMPGNA
jgi:hypothetical protein